MRGIRLAILKDTEGKISMEWAEKWFAQCWAAAQLDPSPQREVSKNHPLATSPAPPKAETEVKG
jgi:hypothetical protein